MTKLCRLIERYVSGKIDFPEFRRAFVLEFLAVVPQGPEDWAAILQVESECDDFAEGVITEDDLKSNLSAKKYSSTSTVIYPVAKQLVISDIPFWTTSNISTGSSNVPAVGASAVGRLVGATLAWEYV